MKTQVQVAFDKKNQPLIMAGWIYVGADYWIDPVSNTKLLTPTARITQRARDKFTASQKKRKPILSDAWWAVKKDLNKQLKPFKLKVVTKKVSGSDLMTWTVERIKDPAYEKYKKQLDKLGIDPWNMVS